MEQETKHKTKKAMAIAGIATLSAFALIGLFAIGALIGGCAEKKQADAPASEPVKTAHIERRAVADGAPNLLTDDVLYHVTWAYDDSSGVATFSRSDGTYCWCLPLSDGLYRLSAYGGNTGGTLFGVTSEFRNGLVATSIGSGASVTTAAPVSFDYVNTSQNRSSVYVALRGYSYYAVWSYNPSSAPILELVNSLDVPPSAVVTLPEDWNPTAWVSDEAIGGYPVVHGSYTTEANASGAYVRVGWSNVVFKTASDSAVFTSLVVRYRWLWNGQKYRINDQTLTYAYSSENALLYPVSVSYQDPLTNTWTIVAKEAQDVIGGDYVHTGKLNWLYPTYRTLGFLVYPENPTSPTIRFYHSGEAGSGEATWQPTPTLQGLTFFDWFGLASWNSPQQVDVGTGNAIGLISTAFSGMVPILGISIFPNITLGLLLFLPLIGGIIVLIIKAVSK